MSSLHDRVVDSLGREIVHGTISPGTIMLAENLEQRYGVSRSVIREALRVLQSLGLIESVKRLGIRVRGLERWNVLDPIVVRWRLAGPDQGAQLRSLTELRETVEPAAAALAAQHAHREAADTLVELAAAMRTAGEAGDRTLFSALDIDFHRTVLRASGNEMFARLDEAIGEVIRGRTVHGMMPEHPAEITLARHEEVARAIAEGRATDAREAMETIMQRTSRELDPIWEDSPRHFL